MHNYYLCQVIKSSFDCRLLSFYSLKNINKYHDIGINYSGISPLISLNINLSTLKNAVRSFSDYNISKQFSDNVNNESGLIEFMDIHSEGYYFLKNNPKKRKNVVIRAHTPFGLLKQYYTKDELNGVDTWFSFEREKKCFQWAKTITTPSIDLKERICSLYNIISSKVTVIPNILDTNHFSPKKNDKNQIFTILHVGRFERAKGVETLIKAFIQLAKKYTNIKLINIGESRGNSLKKCMTLLKNNNLAEKVIFTGFVEYDDLPNYYAKADIVVVPSEIYESFSYTVAQGMACGKPVIGSNIGGISETMDNGHAGLLFKPRNVKQLAHKIETLYLNSDLRYELATKARRYIVDYCSIESLKPKYMEFYKSILN
jgi:glycosyltransferase involved in cell wall biosynthesis